MILYVDIETLPCQAPDALERAREIVKPPANYKKEETIAKWWEEEGERAVQEAWRKTALDPAEGELVAIGYALEDEDPCCLVRTKGEDERAFLERAIAAVDAVVDRAIYTAPDGTAWPADVYLVAHNASFDIGYLLRRSWVHGLRIPRWLPGPRAREGKDYGCTMAMWAGLRGTISLDRLCRALGVPSPKAAGVDGAMVYDLWADGRLDNIAAYCKADVEAVRACWRRMAC